MAPRLLQLMTGAVLAAAALSACRKEVPLPSRPDEVPKPKAALANYAAAASVVVRPGGLVFMEQRNA